MNIIQKVSAMHAVALMEAHFMEILENAIDELPDGEREEKHYHFRLLQEYLESVAYIGASPDLNLKDSLAQLLKYIDKDTFEDFELALERNYMCVGKSSLPHIVQNERDRRYPPRRIDEKWQQWERKVRGKKRITS